MNEKIKKLIGESTWVQFAEEVGYKEVFDKEKFAQLIINECAEVAHCNSHMSGWALGGILKEYFGV